MRLGQVIRKYRTMTELSAAELATEIGISAATLCRIEVGENMDGQTLRRVLEWLMGGTGDGTL